MMDYYEENDKIINFINKEFPLNLHGDFVKRIVEKLNIEIEPTDESFEEWALDNGYISEDEVQDNYIEKSEHDEQIEDLNGNIEYLESEIRILKEKLK